MKGNKLAEDGGIIKHEYPPNWEQIATYLPLLADLKDPQTQVPRVVIAYAPYIYVPGAQVIPPDIFVRGSIHLKQQTVTPLGVVHWWNEYLADPEFRLQEELEAYGAQLAMYNKAPNRYFQHMKNVLAQELASEFYGRIISFGEAATKIRKYARAITHTPFETVSKDSD